MCFVLGLFLGTFANSSAPLLSSKSVHLICNFASGIFNLGFISTINSLKGSTSFAAVDSAMYFAYVVDRAISVCKQLNHVIGQPAYLMIHPVLDFTGLGFSHVSVA